MTTRTLLHPILEAPDTDVEANSGEDSDGISDSLFALETYKRFTCQDWCRCLNMSVFLAFCLGVVGFLIYISYEMLHNHH